MIILKYNKVTLLESIVKEIRRENKKKKKK